MDNNKVTPMPVAAPRRHLHHSQSYQQPKIPPNPTGPGPTPIQTNVITLDPHKLQEINDQNFINEAQYLPDGRSKIYNMTSDPLYSPREVRRRRSSTENSDDLYNEIMYKKKGKKKAPEPKKRTELKAERALLIFEIMIIIMFAIFVKYDENQATPVLKSSKDVSSRAGAAATGTGIGANRNQNTFPQQNTGRYDDRGYSYGSGGYPTSSSSNKDRDYSNTGPLIRPDAESPKNNLHEIYFLFQDVQVMVFVGFGFLMNFLRKYGYSALGITLIVGAVAIQWAILCRGLFNHGEDGYIPIEITTMVNADFAAAAVLISVGAVLGVASPFQLVITTIVEVFLYAVNEYIGTEIFKAIDVGGSMYIHAFGAYFGLALSRMLKPNDEIKFDNEAATRTSDLFAMVGTVFLWVYWPSFNGCLAAGDDQHRAVVNTILSLTGSVIFTYAISILVSKDNKLSMVHIQNATLAGGVAVGAVADLMIKPFGALCIGSIAGTISTLGYVYLTPFLQTKMGLHDTCGINNLHGMTGIIGGLAGSIMAALASETDYGNSLYTQYPARAPLANTSELSELVNDYSEIQAGDNRTAGTQAMYQLAALGVTLVIAIGGGTITGLILRAPMFGNIPKECHFDDTFLWEVPEEEEPTEDVHGVSNKSFEMTVEKVNPNQEP